MKAGPELDNLIAEKVMSIDVCKCPTEFKVRIIAAGWDREGKWFSGCTTCNKAIPKFYSTSIEAAWEVLTHLQNIPHLDTTYSVSMYEHNRHIVVIQEFFKSNGRMFKSVSECGETAPHAICKAALKAVGYNEVI